jgi:hypothetical protein
LYVKLSEWEAGRPNGRLRVRILNDRTGQLVCYPNGRTRWFGSEEAADEWIAAARKAPPPPETLRVWK